MQIVVAAKEVLEITPQNLQDIIDRGIMLTGGGALLDGIDKLFAKELKVPVIISEARLIMWQRSGILLEHMGTSKSRIGN